MLISEPSFNTLNPVVALFESLMGNSTEVIEIQKGVYKIGHFGSSMFLEDYEHYPDTTIGPYGVCDDVSQVLDQCPELTESDRQFVVTLTPVSKSDQPEEGGWRWHKWGEYIGNQETTCEYLYDEPEIEQVYCFHIYEKVNK